MTVGRSVPGSSPSKTGQRCCEEKGPPVHPLNLVPIAVMGLLWCAPMVQFWGAATGPMKPFHYPAVDTSPSLIGFLFGFGTSFLPCLLPESYYRPKAWEAGGRIYEALGVHLFRKVAPYGDLLTPRKRRGDPRYRLLSSRGSLPRRVKETRGGEMSHSILLLMGVFTAAYAVRIGWVGWAVILTAGNALCNLYPILLQRYVRNRIYEIDRKFRSAGRHRGRG
jgi:hypothetical protein